MYTKDSNPLPSPKKLDDVALLARATINRDAEARALARHRAQNSLENPELARELATLAAAMRAAVDALGSPWLVAAASASVALQGLRETIGEHRIARAIRYLSPIDDKKRVLPTQSGFIDSWQDFPVRWWDPCFCPFVSGDGSSLGVLVYPPALDAGLLAPVVFRYHEGSPELAWVAESVAHLERMWAVAHDTHDQAAVDAERGTRHPAIERAIRSADITHGREPGEEERSLVRDLLVASDDEAAALSRKLADLYRERDWKYALTALSAQRIYDEHERNVIAASEAAGAAAVERLGPPSVLTPEATSRLFAQAVTFDLASRPLQMAQPPSEPRFGRSLGFALLRERQTLGGIAWLAAFGVLGLALLTLASRLSGGASIVCAASGLLLVAPLTAAIAARLFTPHELRLDLQARAFSFPAGFARRRTQTVSLRDVVDVGVRVRPEGGLLWWRTDEREFSLPSAMFPPEYPAPLVALRLWIRWVFSRGDHPIEGKELANVERACDEALRSSSATRFLFVTMHDNRRVIGFLKPGAPAVFPGASKSQLDAIGARIEKSAR